ncbi:hypothetical protein AOLI_G00211100 [Acnodon oligacanthus]
MAIQMFLMLLTTVTVQGELSVCNVSDGLQFFGVLGKSVLVHLPMPANTNEIRLQKDSKLVLSLKISGNKITGTNQKHKFFNNGSVQISNVSSNDSGVYKWETFDSAGTFLLNTTFTLKIHEPLPQTHLDILCQSSGERRVQCTPAGQKYRWTLNSAELNSTVAYMSDPGDVIILKGHVTGNLTCIISNEVGGNFASAWLPVCRQSDDSKQVCVDEEKKPGHRAADIPDQLCVNSRIFLLVCGALAVFVTLILALCCLRIALDTKSKSLPEDQPIYTEMEFENQGKEKAWSEIQEMTGIYAEVTTGRNAQQPEGQRDTSNVNLCTYGYD